jgi:uncharacterized protein (TIGR03437 family)
MSTLARSAVAALTLASAFTVFAGDDACPSDSPWYTAKGIVNAASNLNETLAPMTWVSLYGCNLSYETGGRSGWSSEPNLGSVGVIVNNQSALISYVSPAQVNFLMPGTLTAKQVTIYLQRDSDYGPTLTIPIDTTSPELFLANSTTVVAAHENWSLVGDPATKDDTASPAKPGEILILYATGLGQFKNRVDPLEAPPWTANPIVLRTEFKVLLNGTAVEDRLVEYVGAAPGFVGVYQLNLRLPASVAKDPAIQIAIGERVSMAGIHLRVEP